jgi:hypothetical protein
MIRGLFRTRFPEAEDYLNIDAERRQRGFAGSITWWRINIVGFQILA